MGSKAFRNDEKADSHPVQDDNRDFLRGVWELARFHTREAWLCWYPAVWGACVGAGVGQVRLDIQQFSMILFGIWVSITASHAAFCTFNDICDRNLDLHVERCKTRPLPSGMITASEAIAVFIAWLPICYYLVKYTLGDEAVIAFIPVWVLSTIYPFMKRVIPFPQVVLGAVIGGAVFPGWVAVTQNMDDIQAALPLFFATASWVIYFDLFYATQDAADDQKIGVKSLAVLMGNNIWLLLSALGILQVAFFAVTALRAHLSMIFWIAGLAVWAGSMPWHIWRLDLTDRKSGGKIFKDNIKLGLYLTMVTLIELGFTRVYLTSVSRFGPMSVAK